MKHLNVPIEDDLMCRIKSAAAKNGIPLKTWVSESLTESAEREERFNPQTEAEAIIAAASAKRARI